MSEFSASKSLISSSNAAFGAGSEVSVFITKVPAKAVLPISARVAADTIVVLNFKFISFSQTLYFYSVSGNNYHDYICTLYKLVLMSFKN